MFYLLLLLAGLASTGEVGRKLQREQTEREGTILNILAGDGETENRFDFHNGTEKHSWDGIRGTVMTGGQAGKQIVFQNSIMAIQIPTNKNSSFASGIRDIDDIEKKDKNSGIEFPRSKNYDNVFLQGEDIGKKHLNHEFNERKAKIKYRLQNSENHKFRDTHTYELKEFRDSENDELRDSEKHERDSEDQNSGEISRRVFREVSQLKAPPIPEWIFLSKNKTNIGTHVGATVTLNCRIARNSDYEAISWFRLPGPRSTLTLLTVGDDTIIADTRINIVRPILSMNWCLHIANVKKEDEGKYKCQSTTYPPTSIIVNLKVMAAYSEIAGTKEKIVRTGSELHLVCLIHDITTTPSFIFWYQNERMINYDTAAGVSVSLTEHPRNRLKSILRVKNVSPEHSGNYSCSPDNAVPDSVVVRVVNNSPQHQEGMQPAPVQDINSASVQSRALNALLTILSIFIIQSARG